MTKPLFLLTTIAALSLGGLAQAQNAGAGQADGTEESNADVTVLDTGEPVSEGNAPATGEDQTYVRNEHGDWKVQCLRVEEGPEPCQMYQLLVDEQGGSVAEVSLFKIKNGGQVAAGGTFVVPLETLLTQKLTIQVDSAQAKRYDYSFCTPIGCYSRVGFGEADVAAFKRGNLAKVSIVPALAPDQRVTVDMSLSGFTAAYDEITSLEQGQ